MTDATLSPWLVHLLGRAWIIFQNTWKFLAGAGGLYLLRRFYQRHRYGSYSVNIGLPFNLGSRTYDTTPWDRVVAWKLYVQLTTRKAALPFDEDFDLISEVYDSLFAIFAVTRKLLLGLPPHEFEREGGVAPLLLRVINDGLRPHLTRWQADFRMWWDGALAATTTQGKSPQEVQRMYPQYSELVTDLKRTNTELSKLADELLTIARAPKLKRPRTEKVMPLPPTPQSKVEGPVTADYMIEPDGKVLVLKSVRATQRGTGPKPPQGARLAFKTKYDTADFVQMSEVEGFTFEGKEYLAGG
jgi:hypothetical protein